MADAPDRHFLIAIEGPIGVGKTTLARSLAPDLDAEVVLEIFEENPFLRHFYADRERYAFQTQVFFLLSRYQQLRPLPEKIAEHRVVCDYTFDKNLLFARLTLGGDELDLYEQVHASLAEKTPTPDLIVYLRADLDTLLERIALRDRPYERDMDPDYMRSLIWAYDLFFQSYRACPVLTVDTQEVNFVRDREATGGVAQRIRSVLRLGEYQALLFEA